MERKLRIGPISIDPYSSTASAPVKRSFLAKLRNLPHRQIEVIPFDRTHLNGTPSLMNVQLMRLQPTSTKPYPIIEKVVTVIAENPQKAMKIGVALMRNRVQTLYRVDKIKSI